MQFETKPGQSSRTARRLRTSTPWLGVPTSYPVGDAGALSSQREGETMTHLRAHRAAASPARAQAGLTLVELMVALTIGLIIIGAIGTLFIGSSGARREVQSSADAFENARYAMDLLTRELAQAGFYGAWTRPYPTPYRSEVSADGSDSDGIPCSTARDKWAASVDFHVMGWNQDESSPTCLTDRKVGTDAIFIQRLSTCEAGTTGCADLGSNGIYLQVAECIDDGGEDPRIRVGDAAGKAGLTLRAKDCSAAAPKRRFIRRIYYVSQDDVLSYREIGPGGPGNPVALVENIEQLQVAYAVDINDDGSPEQFEPASAIPPAVTPPDFDWPDVVGVRVWLAARSETESDRRPAGLTQSFELGDMPANGLDLTKAYRRSVSSSYISFVSPTLRKAK